MCISEPGRSLLIVGPDPYSSEVGGVAKHIQVLSRLELSSYVTFHDPGSIAGKMTWKVMDALGGAFGVGKVARRIQAKQVWINSSIYTLAFLKLLLILIGMQLASESTVRVFFHGGRFETISYLKGNAFRKLCWTILRRASSFHFLSREQGEGFSTVFPSAQWELFSNFLPESELLTRNQAKVKAFLFIGRLVKEKGIYDILAAIERLLKRGLCLDGVEFWFVGDGPELEMLRKKSSGFPAGTIRTLGVLRSNELNSVYQSAFALILPSYSEGFPYVVIEAMRAGLPVLCTATGALVDLVKPEENGFVVRVRDPEDLADAIWTLVSDEALAKRIGENNARYFLEKLSKKAAEDYYGRLLK